MRAGYYLMLAVYDSGYIVKYYCIELWTDYSFTCGNTPPLCS